MAFIIDKQTLTDLKIFNKPQSDSIFGIFNKVRTRGSARILEDMFRYPLSEPVKIRERIEIFRFFMDRKIELGFNSEWFDAIEHYLSDTDERARLKAHNDTMRQRINRLIGADVSYAMIHKAVASAVELCREVRVLMRTLEEAPAALRHDVRTLGSLLDTETFAWTTSETTHLTYAKVAMYDDLLRYRGIDDFRRFLEILYRIDVYGTVAKVGMDQGFVLPEVLPDEQDDLYIKGLRHPLLKNAVANDVSMTKGQKVIFLTGANMAGKSTFMKSFGTIIFLAHMGFPVPAEEMKFSVHAGMYTTINLPDNMHMGFSHFYAEVRRLRKVADQVNRVGRLVIIFDELFRGTNVKDAHEATVEVMRAFAERNDCIFMISTHIIEAGEDLRDHSESIKFVYFPTIIGSDGRPKYTYRLTEGITADRHGMMIVNNERIIEILKPKV